MTILVDECIWPWRDRLWCHMVSDTSLDELHAFARWLGVPERGFQGDHYDIPEEVRAMALDEGAVAVSSRISPASRSKRSESTSSIRARSR